jgi:hypothetical protein
MATRARIGIKQKSGRIIAAYQHWDGYPGGLGYTLINHWESPKKTTQAIELGNSSKWGYFVGSKIDFDNRESEMYEYQNIYYGRDRGEKDQGPRIFQSEADYLENGFRSGEEYIYLMKDTGKKDFMNQNSIGEWYYAHYDYTTEFKPLYEKAIREHIEQWQYDLKQKEVA